MTHNKIIPLGSNGWIPRDNRQTCSYLVEYQDQLMLFDAGTGIARLGDEAAARLLKRYNRLYLFISHFHLDHISGLIYFAPFLRGKTLHVAGPGQPLYSSSLRQTLNDFTREPFFAKTFDQSPMDLHFHDLTAGETTIDGLKVETIVQQHSHPSLGFKIDDTLCYCTDTTCTSATASFVAGSQVVMHEVWYDKAGYDGVVQLAKESPQQAGGLKAHSAVSAVARAMADGQVNKLVMIHLNPLYSEIRLKAMQQEARAIFPGSLLAQDNEVILF